MRLISTSLLLLCCLPDNEVKADPFAGLFINSMDFDYTETDPAGNFIDGETGRLTGRTLLIGYRTDSVEHSIHHTQYEDDVDYNGITGGVTPQTLVSTTDTRVRKTAYRQLWTGLREQYRTSIYAELAYHKWDRNILPTTTPVASSGLIETYSWKSVELGVNIDIVNYKEHALELGAGFIANIDSSISIFLEGNSALATNDEYVSFKLGDKPGRHISLNYKYRLTPAMLIVAAVDNTQWEFGANTISARRLPTAVVSTITEPASTSDHTRLQIGLVTYF